MKNQIAIKTVLSKVECGLKLMHCPFFVPFKKVPFVSLCTWLIAFFTLVFLSSCASMQSESCRGFPFDKAFPGQHHRPFAVRYDLSYKWVTGKDGVYYDFVYKSHRKDQKLPSDVYNDKHLSLSTYEKKYIATRQAKDKKFDQKYAGKIKKKLLAVAEKKWIPPRSLKFQTQWKAKRRYPMGFKYEKGYMEVKYPYYLTGDMLPAGLKTPASFFSPYFFADYIVAYGHKDHLMNYFISAKRWPKSRRFYQRAMDMARVGGMVTDRFQANFAEYVLTYYFYKDYADSRQRMIVAKDLATYYSDVAFRASAEYLYADKHLLSSSDRCDYANHVAQRIYNYIITVFMDPTGFQKIKDEYRDELLNACWANRSTIWYRKHKPPSLGRFWTKEQKESKAMLRKKIYSGAVRCIND